MFKWYICNAWTWIIIVKLTLLSVPLPHRHFILIWHCDHTDQYVQSSIQSLLCFQAPICNALITSSRHWPSNRWKVKIKNTTLVQTHGLWSSAGLKMPTHAKFYRPAIWTSKVGQGDLVFDMKSGFATRSLHERLQVYVQRLRLVPPWLSQNLIHRFWPFDPSYPKK